VRYDHAVEETVFIDEFERWFNEQALSPGPVPTTITAKYARCAILGRRRRG
jgi:hypothetical protein